MKKRSGPVVDHSLEATRSIEFQLLNMKNELEKFPLEKNSKIDLIPTVSQTLETLQQIDLQLKNMCSSLEKYSRQFGNNEEYSPVKDSFTTEEPNPPPFPPVSPPTFPPTYPSEYQSPPIPPPFPPWAQYHMQNQYYYPPFYNPYMYYSPPPFFMPRHFPPNSEDSRVFPQDYPPFLPPSRDYPNEPYEQYGKYYESAKRPTVASSEPAYSKQSKAIPSQVFKIAYYPWEQLTGKRTPMDSRVPYVNLYDLGKEYLVYVELPGVEKENIEIRVDEQSIWINGKPTIIGGEDGTPIVQEHGFHEFSRQLYLPSTIITNRSSCKFENGILKILLMKEKLKKPIHQLKVK